MSAADELALAYQGAGRPTAARPPFDRAPSAVEKSGFRLACSEDVLRDAADADAERFATEEGLRRKLLELATRKYGAKTPEVAEAQSALGTNLSAQKKYAEAEPLLLAAHAHWAEQPAEGEAAGRLADLYAAWGHPKDAARWRALAGGSPSP